MHLGIIIPLKSKLISKDWQVTCKALFNTLNSILNQSCQDFSVIVVGHDEPDKFKENYPNVHFESVQFPPPNRSAEHFSHMELVCDKNLKIVFGIKCLKVIENDKIDYWYQLDSDDLLHKDFIKEVKGVEGSRGAVLDGGYFVFEGSKRAVKTSEMSLYCGSTSILSDLLIDLPEQIDKESIKKVPWARIPHNTMHKFFQESCGGDYITFHNRLIGYVLASGDNISDNWRNGLVANFLHKLKPFIVGKKLNREFLKDFGLLKTM